MPLMTRADEFWTVYLRSLPHDAPHPERYFEAFRFGNTEKLANECATLVLRGIKTATSGLLWSREAEGKPLWRAGDLHIVTTWDHTPACVIETVELDVRPFENVDARFARDYGEGDRTLEWWRGHMWRYYVKECQALGREPASDMPLICERFRMVFPKTRFNGQVLE